MDPDPDPGGPKTYGSGSATLLHSCPLVRQRNWCHVWPELLLCSGFAGPFPPIKNPELVPSLVLRSSWVNNIL
jgi:hypothetical protein